jgi:hypothetical protein
MALLSRNVDESRLQSFVEAVQSDDRVSKLTHTFYNYPARFSPRFAEAAITTFSEPGDLVLDPFMGGGTTLVEARIHGRHAVGSDISSLAVFLARVKTTLYSEEELASVREWARELPTELSCHRASGRFDSPLRNWIEKGYQRNLNTRQTWPIRKLLEQAVEGARKLDNDRVEGLARCGILKTGQWALDSRKNIPSATEFRDRLSDTLLDLCDRASDYRNESRKAEKASSGNTPISITSLNCSAEEIDSRISETRYIPSTPRLILTSPPYPGVHVLYHRWQVRGRRETPAPFWIANCLDGEGESYYTMGGRHQDGLPQYFEQAKKVYTKLAELADHKTVLVQMLGFSDSSWQLPKFLEVMEEAGFAERKLDSLGNSPDGRLWREVPNRKWYNEQGKSTSSGEVVLFHRLK